MAEENGKRESSEAPSAVVKKPSLKSRVFSAIVAEEVHDVKEYLLFDVAIPTLKKTLFDLVTNALNLTLFGKPTSGRDDDRRSGPYVSYSAYSRSYEREREDPRRDRRHTRVDIRHLDSVEFRYREKAIDAINFLKENLEEYGYATVAEFLTVAGLETNSVHSNWGWYDIGNPVPQQLSNGWYYVKLPKPRPID